MPVEGSVEDILPFLPGYRSKEVHENYHKPQFCGVKDGVRVVRKSDEDRTAVEELKMDVATWISHDKEVLRFYGQYRDDQVTSAGEPNPQLIKIALLFYLEDETVQISKERGSSQTAAETTLFRRQSVPVEGDPQKHVVLSDIQIGQSIRIFGRSFQVLGCDSFTRDWLIKFGRDVPPTAVMGHQMNKTLVATPGRPKKSASLVATTTSKRSFKQFFQHDGQVLRLYCIWDDRPTNPEGQVHRLLMHYFLADDSIEIREQCPPSYHNTKPFLRRGVVPKQMTSVCMDGSNLGWTEQTDAYHFHDLILGSIVKIYGKRILICDGDEYTTTFFRSHAPECMHDVVPVDRYQALDPITGQIILSAIPTEASDETPVQEVSTFLPGSVIREPKKKGVDDRIVLRFSATLKSQDALDRLRRFVIAYYYVDNSFSVYENALANSGIPGGKFLERCQIKKPGTNVNYSPKDLAVGAEMIFFGRTFVLDHLDSHTAIHVTRNPGLFPNLQVVL